MIFLDLDGVLVNFVAGVGRFFGYTEEELLAKWKPGEYSVHVPLRLADENDMWTRLRAMSASEWWWADLEPYPQAIRLFEMLSKIDEVTILTSPNRDPGCLAGKQRWMNNHLAHGGQFRNFIITPRKHLLAGPSRILIDDWDKHVDRWDKNGGQSILYPRIWNSLHAVKQDLVMFVENQIKILKS